MVRETAHSGHRRATLTKQEKRKNQIQKVDSKIEKHSPDEKFNLIMEKLQWRMLLSFSFRRVLVTVAARRRLPTPLFQAGRALP